MAPLGPADILGPYPAADDASDEHKGTDNDGCCPCGEGRPLDVNEGELPGGMVDRFFCVLSLLLELPELCGIARAV